MNEHDPSDGWDSSRRPSPIPEDVVRYGDQRTAEHYQRMNDRTGQSIVFRTPGQPIEDVNGSLVGMTPASEEPATFYGAIVTRHELERVGLSPEDVPNLRVIDAPNPQEDQ